jgi:phosphotriesterase-related protein
MSESIVPTARGGVPVSRLGPTLMHEHIFTSTFEVTVNWPETFGDEDAHVAAAAANLDAAAAVGIATIVDLTVVGLGRYIPRIVRVAERTSVNVVVATGLYVQTSLPRYFQWQGPGTWLGGPELMDDLFVRDIEVGIADTGVRAGVLKCVTDRAGITPDVERVLRAVARAHRRTGVPIATHSAGPPTGLDQQRIFRQEGVDLSRVVIGHVGDTADMDYVQQLLDNGSSIGMDRFGMPPGIPLPEGHRGDEDRAETIARLCRLGYAGQLVLSHDAATHRDVSRADGSGLGVSGYTHLSSQILPMLRELGVSDTDITTMIVDGPARLLAPFPAY